MNKIYPKRNEKHIALDISFNVDVRLKLIVGVISLFHCGHFEKNEISFWVIKYHVNSTRNEIPTHVHQNIGSF